MKKFILVRLSSTTIEYLLEQSFGYLGAADRPDRKLFGKDVTSAKPASTRDYL